MKANYKVVNNRQAQLKKVIQNFEPTGVCAFLMFRYYVMQLMVESEAAGGLNVPLSDSAELRVSDNVDGFFSSAKDEAVSNYLDPDDESKDVTIHFDGTPEEFSKELESYILVAMVSNFEHAFLDFSDVTGISRGHFELAVAKFMSEYEQTEGNVNSFCDYEYEE